MMSLVPDIWAPYALSFLLVLFRVGTMVSVMPAFGERSIPARVKLAVAFCITLVIYPVVQSANHSTFDDTAWVSFVIIEVGIGAWFGLLLRVFVFCLQTAGSIAAQSTSLSQILGTAGVEPLPAIGHVITMAGMALALTLGLHVSVVQYVIGSYTLFPVGQWPNIEVITQTGVDQIGWGFQLAFSLAAPFFILSLLYNLTLGVINRAMPQLMVAFVGAPVITAGALILLAIAIPLMLGTWARAMFTFLNVGVLG